MNEFHNSEQWYVIIYICILRTKHCGSEIHYWRTLVTVQGSTNVVRRGGMKETRYGWAMVRQGRRNSIIVISQGKSLYRTSEVNEETESRRA